MNFFRSDIHIDTPCALVCSSSSLRTFRNSRLWVRSTPRLLEMFNDSEHETYSNVLKFVTPRVWRSARLAHSPTSHTSPISKPNSPFYSAHKTQLSLLLSPQGITDAAYRLIATLPSSLVELSLLIDFAWEIASIVLMLAKDAKG